MYYTFEAHIVGPIGSINLPGKWYTGECVHN